MCKKQYYFDIQFFIVDIRLTCDTIVIYVWCCYRFDISEMPEGWIN